MNNNTINGNLGYRGEDGFSAYELYVQNGGTLTEEEWLDAFLNSDNYYTKSEINSNIYNKSEANNLLNAKANTNDLSTVATSGSYNDLTNKPNLINLNKHAITVYVAEKISSSTTADAISFEPVATKIGDSEFLTVDDDRIFIGNTDQPQQGDKNIKHVKISGSLCIENTTNADMVVNALIKLISTNTLSGQPEYTIISKGRMTIPAGMTRVIVIPTKIQALVLGNYAISVGFWQGGAGIRVISDDTASFITVEAIDYEEF